MAGCGLWNVWMSRWNAAASQAQWSSCTISLPAAHPLRNQHVFITILQHVVRFHISSLSSVGAATVWPPVSPGCANHLGVVTVWRFPVWCVLRFPRVSPHLSHGGYKSGMEAAPQPVSDRLSIWLLSQMVTVRRGAVRLCNARNDSGLLPWMRRRGEGVPTTISLVLEVLMACYCSEV